MICKDEIVVLGVVNYKGRNAVIKTFGKEHGFKSFYLSRSASGKSNKKKNNFQPFSLLDIVYNNSKSSLPQISEFQVVNPLIEIKTDVKKSAIAFLLCEVLTKVLAEGERNSMLYAFIREQILELNSVQSISNFHLHFLVDLCDYLGIQPSLKAGSKFFDIKEGEFRSSFPNHPRFMSEVNTARFIALIRKNKDDSKFTGEDRSQFLDELFLFYEYHVEGFTTPKSLEVLKELFSF